MNKIEFKNPDRTIIFNLADQARASLCIMEMEMFNQTYDRNLFNRLTQLDEKFFDIKLKTLASEKHEDSFEKVINEFANVTWDVANSVLIDVDNQISSIPDQFAKIKNTEEGKQFINSIKEAEKFNENFDIFVLLNNLKNIFLLPEKKL